MPRYHDDIEQGTEEWLALRLGKMTASDFHVMLGKSQTKTDKLFEIVFERMTHNTDQENYSSFAMERGKILEAEARRLYSAMYETPVKQTGFVEPDGDEPFQGFIGASPDGLLDEDGGLEIKCPLGKNFLQWTALQEDGTRTVEYIKPEYKTQLEFNLMVTGRKYWDFCYYHPLLGLVVKRVESDPELREKIKTSLTDCIEFIKSYTKE